MNVLLTSAGRRTYLVDYFKEALCGSGKVYAVNSAESPALFAADGYAISPLIYSEEYIPFLLRFCETHAIGLMVPLFDIDLPVLARHRREFEAIGVKTAVSDPETLLCCNDKYNMYLKLWKSGIRCPETTLSVEDALLKLMANALQFPLVIKPRMGMGSISVSRAYDKAELKAGVSLCRRAIEQSYLKYESAACPKESVLIQQLTEGNEYGLDVINDLSGNYVTTIVKRKLAMRAGETDEAVTLGADDPEYEILRGLGAQISAAFSHTGNMDVDVILDPANMRPYVIDMNARFGGGYPFSHLAGVNLPKAYLLWAEGREVPGGLLSARPGVRAYKEIVMKYARGDAGQGVSEGRTPQ